MHHEVPANAPQTAAARAAVLDAAAAHGVDLVIVGGGITGAGTAADAALRGLKVLLVEAGDWGRGTSSRSSKLVHGGLRYLENLEFGLVMEGTRERHLQRVLNPHLVQPLPFLMPFYRGGRHSLAKVNVGLWLYDVLSLLRTPRVHTRLSPRQAAEKTPALRRDGLEGAMLYYDCRGDDARLTLANALAASTRGALISSYTRFDGPTLGDNGRVTSAEVTDQLTGQTWRVPCKHIAIAAGAWTDTLAARLGHPVRLRPTRGVHLVVDRARLPVDVAIALSAPQDGRVVFVIPNGNTTYLGTTDTDDPNPPDDTAATSEDVTYLLATANHFFPASHLVPADVRSTWAALRPLVRSDAETAYGTSREHAIWHDPRGISTIAGGKLTTYRAMAEEFLDAILEQLRSAGHRPPLGPCATRVSPLDPGAAALLSDPDPALRTFAEAQGSLARAVAARIQADPSEGERLDPELPWVWAQVAVAVDHEQAQTVEDILVRRFQVFFRAADAGLACAPRVARILARHLGHDAAWEASQVAAFSAYVETHLRCAREPSSSLALAATA
jgi:glycerol-3-phosphate dehydrogenase